MTREQALRKIKKLLALAGSSNANEAATAMRQAQALMREYQLSAHEAAGVEEKAHLARGQAVRIGLSTLANLVAALYSAELYLGYAYKNYKLRRTFVFVSDAAGTAEICTYAMEVLARVRGLRAALKLWEIAVVPRSAALTAYMDGLKLGKGKEIKPREAKVVSVNDRHAGYEAGKKAQLSKGVKQDRAALEHGL